MTGTPGKYTLDIYIYILSACRICRTQRRITELTNRLHPWRFGTSHLSWIKEKKKNQINTNTVTSLICWRRGARARHQFQRLLTFFLADSKRRQTIRRCAEVSCNISSGLFFPRSCHRSCPTVFIFRRTYVSFLRIYYLLLVPFIFYFDIVLFWFIIHLHTRVYMFFSAFVFVLYVYLYYITV
jgi:hypothetical protein